MTVMLAHFAICADDVERAREFYREVFGWVFTPWGPPGFYRFSDAGVHGALQSRQESSAVGNSFELTFAVSSVPETSDNIQKMGGRVIGEPFAIPDVGTLIKFEDTEGNQAVIMEYLPEKAKEMGLVS